MNKYTDEEIRDIKNVTTKVAGDYLGVPPMAVAIGLREQKLPIGYAIKRINKWSYYIIPDRLIAYKNGNLDQCLVEGIEKRLDEINKNFILLKDDLLDLLNRNRER